MGWPSTADGNRVEVGDEVLATIDWRRPGVLWTAATHHRPNPRRQLARAEGLTDVVIRAGIETQHAVALRGARGQHDDGRFGRARTGTKQSTDFEAAEHGQIEIENDEIGRLLAGELEGLVAASRHFDAGVA